MMNDKYNILISRGSTKSYARLKQILELENEFARLNILYGADKVERIMKATSCSIFVV